MTSGDDERASAMRPWNAALLRSLQRFGADAMSFLALESKMMHWIDEAPPGGTGARVAYFDTGSAWVGAAGPLAAEDARSVAAARFMAAARSRGRRASFFGTESLVAPHFKRLLLGEQPIFRPREWLEALPPRGSLREQLRRARAKGVRVRSVAADELGEGTPLSGKVLALARDWLQSRHMEPMGFLVALELFQESSEHRYFLAERGGVPIGFLSAVPIYGHGAWLVEDVVRAREAPNGTTESLFVALLHDVRDAPFVTLGLTPLSGDIVWPLRLARLVSRPLFDFPGLRAFRARLHPHEWQPVWLVHPEGQPAVVPLLDALRAFANGTLLRFALRSIVAHPSGPPWLLAIPLVPWTSGLAVLAAFGRPSLLGFAIGPRWAWVVFDALLAVLLYGTAMRPSRSRLLFATLLAAGDAALSFVHVASAGLGENPVEHVMRLLAVAAPCAGTVVLAWATTRAGTPGYSSR